MIKLQVDHNKHPKGSGAKLQLKKSKDKKGMSPENQSKIIEQPEPPKEDKKDKKKGKQEKKEKDKKDKKDKKKEKEQEKEEKVEKSKDKKDKKDKKQQKKEEKVDKSKDKKDKKGKKEKQDKKKGKDKKADKSKDKMSSSLLKKEDQEEATIQNIKKSQQHAKLTIEELIQQYKDAAERILFNNNGSDPDKQRQIQKHLQKLQKQKEARHKKLSELQKHKEQIYESRLKQKQVKKQLKLQRLRQKKIERIEQKLKDIEQTSAERKEDYKKFIQYVKERKKVVPRYKRYDEQFKQKQKQFIQNSSQVLQQLAKVHEPMNLEEINDFQEHYRVQREQGENYRFNKIRLEQDMIKEENKKMQKGLWRGKCHEYVKQQIQTKQHKKHENSQKQDNRKEFGKYIKEKLMKDIDNKEDVNENKEAADIEQDQENKQRIRVREKYIKGVNYGLVKQQKTIPLSQEEKAKLGNEYLVQIRALQKHRINKTVEYNSPSKNLSQSQQLKEKSKTFKMRRKSNPYYSSEARKGTLDFNNYQALEFSLQRIGIIEKEKKLHDQIIRHGDFHGILDIQERKRRAGSLVVKQINQKLNVLEKL